MAFKSLQRSVDVPDDDFNLIYPENIRLLAGRHWSPVAVAKNASEFLVAHSGTRVLDIGSGAGKFCMVGAALTKGHFTGVEQRLDLFELSMKISVSHGLHNVEFIHANITSIDFIDYHGFYFYNSFFENVDSINRIDDVVNLDVHLYYRYTMYMSEQLNRLPSGVRLATYCVLPTVIPHSFKLIDSLHSGSLNLWEKIV